MRLFHFTRRQNLGAILEEGITRGDVPLTIDTGITAPCLTTQDDPAFLRDVLRDPVNEGGLSSPLLDKTRVRIAVDFEPRDPLLVRWKEFPKVFRVDTRFHRILTSVARLGNPAYEWYVHLGPIPPERFAEVFDTRTRELITPDKWAPIIAEPRKSSGLLDWVRVIPIEEARR